MRTCMAYTVVMPDEVEASVKSLARWGFRYIYVGMDLTPSDAARTATRVTHHVQRAVS